MSQTITTWTQWSNLIITVPKLEHLCLCSSSWFQELRWIEWGQTYAELHLLLIMFKCFWYFVQTLTEINHQHCFVERPLLKLHTHPQKMQELNTFIYIYMIYLPLHSTSHWGRTVFFQSQCLQLYKLLPCTPLLSFITKHALRQPQPKIIKTTIYTHTHTHTHTHTLSEKEPLALAVAVRELIAKSDWQLLSSHHPTETQRGHG